MKPGISSRTKAFVEPLESRIAPAVLVVSSTADSGPNTLRQALITADTTPHTAPDTIVFHFKGPANAVNVIDLQTELESHGNVIIAGPGPAKLIIDATAASSRAFYFDNGVFSKDSPATVMGLSIVGGNLGGSGNGGAIYSLHSLTLKNVVISDNIAGSGGGVDVDGTASAVPIKAVITGSVITNNKSSNDGGGLLLTHLGAITISNSIISGNISTSLAGGGLYANITAAGPGISIASTQITGNTAYTASAAFLSDTAAKPSKITVSGSVISANAAKSDLYFTGGLYISHGHTTISGTTISGNTAVGSGAGIEAFKFDSLAIAGCTIEGNQDTGTTNPVNGAAGVYIVGSSASVLPLVTISGSTIVGNSATHGTGGIQAQSGVALSVTGTRVIGNSGEIAGGIEVIGGGSDMVNLTISNSVFAGNTGLNRAGGIYTDSTGTISLTGDRITDNSTLGSGGGAALDNGGTTTVRGTIITGNVSRQDSGGGLFVYNTVLKLSGGTITGNSASNNGGGLYTRVTTGTVTGTTISKNAAGVKGGGIYDYLPATPNTVTLKGVTVSGNLAPTGPNLYGTGIMGT